jgi:hypothetical protein
LRWCGTDPPRVAAAEVENSLRIFIWLAASSGHVKNIQFWAINPVQYTCCLLKSLDFFGIFGGRGRQKGAKNVNTVWREGEKLLGDKTARLQMVDPLT